MKITDKIKAQVMLPYACSGIEVDLSNTDWYKQEAKLRNRFIKATLAGVTSHKLYTLACIEQNIKTQNGGLQWLNLSAFKLILKPLSKISKEDADGVVKIMNYEQKDTLKDILYIAKFKILDSTSPEKAIEIYQFLQSKGYDMPQYLLGGKTLQDVGLAIYEKQKRKLKK